MNALQGMEWLRQSGHKQSVEQLKRSGKQYERWLYIILLAVTLGLTPLLATTQVQLGAGIVLGLLVAACLIVLMTRWPVLGFYVLAACALVVEQDQLSYTIFTDRLYVFGWPARLQGLPERPIGFLALFILALLISSRLSGRLGAALRLGPLIVPFVLLLACVVMGVAHGLATGGNFKVIVLEVRPFWYLFVTYLIAYNLITEKRHVIGFLWLTVIATFFKALQGVYIVVVKLHGHTAGVNEIMAHEQSFFFVIILLIILMCLLLKRLYGLMWIALISTPFLIIALIANNRRADYSAFLIGAVAAWLLAIAIRPDLRKGLVTALIVCTVLFSGYVLAFQNASGSIAEPAHSIISVIRPSATDARDQASNLYRDYEDFDLKFTEKQSPILGYGFGKPFLQPEVLPNIIGADPYYNYIPHNTILWVWMRLGPLGYAALFYLIGAFVVRAGIMARTLRDRDLQYVAIFGIAVMFIELPLAYGDYQLFFYRNIFYLGLLMGMLMRLPDLDTKAPDSADTTTPPQQKRRPAITRRLVPVPSRGVAVGAPALVNASVSASEPPNASARKRAALRSGAYLRTTLNQSP